VAVSRLGSRHKVFAHSAKMKPYSAAFFENVFPINMQPQNVPSSQQSPGGPWGRKWCRLKAGALSGASASSQRPAMPTA